MQIMWKCFAYRQLSSCKWWRCVRYQFPPPHFRIPPRSCRSWWNRAPLRTSSSATVHLWVLECWNRSATHTSRDFAWYWPISKASYIVHRCRRLNGRSNTIYRPASERPTCRNITEGWASPPHIPNNGPVYVRHGPVVIAAPLSGH